MRNTKGHSTTVLSASRASTTSSNCAVSSWEGPSPSSTALLQTEYNADQDGQAWIGWDWASDDNLWHYPLGLGVGGVHRVNERGREVLVIPRRTMLPSVLLGSGWAARDSVAQKRHFRLIWALGGAVAIGMWAEVMDTHLGLAYKDTAPCSLHSACWSDVLPWTALCAVRRGRSCICSFGWGLQRAVQSAAPCVSQTLHEWDIIFIREIV